MSYHLRSAYIVLCFFTFLLASGCRDSPAVLIKGMQGQEGKASKIMILPLGNFPSGNARNTTAQLQKIVSNVTLLQPLPLPRHAYYAPRNRYRADSLIQWMRAKAGPGEVYVGLTLQDISTTKNEHADWGVMGLAYTPGKACVVSNHRLKDKSNFFKVVIHELGHTTGLPHCPEKACFMRDAKGGDPTGEEKEFCQRCSRHLRSKGWKLS